MNEQAPQETDVIGLLKKMQQQLVYLEKKIDTLITQRPQNFSRPFRPYGRPQHAGENRPAGNHPDRPAHFNKHRSEGGAHGYVPKKKPFYGKRER